MNKNSPNSNSSIETTDIFDEEKNYLFSFHNKTLGEYNKVFYIVAI